MRMVRYIILFALCCTSVGLGEEVSSSPCLGIQVFHGGKREEGLSERLMVALAGTPGLRVVERSLFEQLLREWEMQGLAPSTAPGIAAGQIEGVDFFVWVHLPEHADDGMLEVVSARTGQWLAKVRCNREFDSLYAMIVNLVQRLQEQPPQSSGANVPAIAVAFPEKSIGEALPEATQRRLTADLTGRLIEGQIMVLHRHFTDLLVQERWWEQKGVVAASSKAGLLRGADVILIPSVTRTGDGERLELALLEVATGIRLAEAQWPVVITNELLQVPETVVAWVAQTLETHLPVRQSTTPSHRNEKLQPETLRLFSRGLLLFADGRYCEALDYLMETATHDLRFHDPVDWMSACFKALDFPEVVDQLDVFWSGAKKLDAESPFHPNQKLRLELSPGVNLLGVSGSDSAVCPESGTVPRLLTEAIEANKLGPVFRSSDWRYLISEYDALIGVEKALGHGWGRVPLLLFEDTLSVHLTRHGDRWQMDVVRIHRLEPETIRRITIALDQDASKWPDAISDGIRKLFTESGEYEAVPAPEPFCDSQSLIELLNAVKQKGPISDYLALLRRHPAIGIRKSELPMTVRDRSNNEAAWFNHVENGIKDWLLRVLPDDDPIKVTRLLADPTQFALFQGVSGLKTEWLTSNPQCVLQYFQAHAARFHDPEVEIAIAYYTLMNTLKPSNYRETREALEALMQPDTSFECKSLIRSVHAALSVSLGEPYELPEYNYGAPPHERTAGWAAFLEKQGWQAWKYLFGSHVIPGNGKEGRLSIARSWPVDYQDYARENGEDAGQLFLWQHAIEHGRLPNVDILEHAGKILDLLPGSPIALDHVAIWLEASLKLGNTDYSRAPAWQYPGKPECVEAYIQLCEKYAASLVRYFDSPDANHIPTPEALWWLMFFDERLKPRGTDAASQLNVIFDPVKQSILRAVEEKRATNHVVVSYAKAQGGMISLPAPLAPERPIEEILLERVKREQEMFHAPDKQWRIYMDWKFKHSSPDEWRRMCIDYDDQLNAHPRHKYRLVVNGRDRYAPSMLFLAWHFYRMGEDERAERLYAQICGIEVNKSSTITLNRQERICAESRQAAWFMRVLLAHRAGDVPRAFRLAQEGIQSFEGVNYMAKPPLAELEGYSPVSASYTVLEFLQDFVERARADPELPFVCPIEAYEKTTDRQL